MAKASLNKVLVRAHISLIMLQKLHGGQNRSYPDDRTPTHIIDDPRDPEPLTPSDLFYGRG